MRKHIAAFVGILLAFVGSNVLGYAICEMPSPQDNLGMGAKERGEFHFILDSALVAGYNMDLFFGIDV